MSCKSFAAPASKKKRVTVSHLVHLGGYGPLHTLISMAQARNSCSARCIEYALPVVKG